MTTILDPETTLPDLAPAANPAQASVLASAAPFAIPQDIRTLLVPAPTGGTQAFYEGILTQVAEAIRPRNFLEWVLVQDMVNEIWEGGRLRRAIVARIDLAMKEGIELILASITLTELDYQGNREVSATIYKQARDILLNQNGERATLDARLKKLGFAPTTLKSAANLVALKDIEMLESMIDRCGVRRDAIMREIDRQRDVSERRARQAVQTFTPIIDAHFE